MMFLEDFNLPLLDTYNLISMANIFTYPKFEFGIANMTTWC
jgi:hypothetical protein